MTLAHRGVLFLDELGEFASAALDALRQPLEDGEVTVARQRATVVFPSRFQLVAATNPCPCGHLGDDLVGCRCTAAAKARYRKRTSGPLLDRIDIRLRVARLQPDEFEGQEAESSAAVKARVVAARMAQEARGALNRDLSSGQLGRTGWDAGSRASASSRESEVVENLSPLKIFRRSLIPMYSPDPVVS